MRLCLNPASLQLEQVNPVGPALKSVIAGFIFDRSIRSFANAKLSSIEPNRMRYGKSECCAFTRMTLDANVAFHQIEVFLHNV